MSRARRSSGVGVRDVAVAAGVSTQTVSRVINDYPGIRAETRQRVIDAMASLDYRVNNAARALGTQESRTIGVIVSNASMFGPALGLSALESAARAEGRWVATAFVDSSEEHAIFASIEHLRGQGVDGIILVALGAHARPIVEAHAGDIPVVELHGAAGAQANCDGSALAVAHLVEQGHCRIGRVAGPPDWLEESARSRGFVDALTAHELQPSHEWVGDWSAASGAQLAPRVAIAAREEAGPTAIVVANDQMALGLIAGLHERGITVPRDLSVVGFDDNPDAAYYQPALTTVRLEVAAEARRCVAVVLESARDSSMLRRPSPAGQAPAPMLVARASTAPPRTTPPSFDLQTLPLSSLTKESS